MENKYYIPSIEEFHIGFEYEWNNPDEDDIWRFAIADLESCYHCAQDIEQKLNYNRYRVKYLDKEDIESLGFKLYKIHTGTTTHEFQTHDSRYYITFDPYFGDKWNITIQDEVDFIFFHGYIKNKSELKVILKQIGYENSLCIS